MSFKLSLASAALFGAVGACFGMITSTQADLLNLTLDGVKFTDGGAASGTFMFNTTTNALSNISITTTPGSVMPGPGNSGNKSYFIRDLVFGSHRGSREICDDF